MKSLAKCQLVTHLGPFCFTSEGETYSNINIILVVNLPKKSFTNKKSKCRLM